MISSLRGVSVSCSVACVRVKVVPVGWCSMQSFTCIHAHLLRDTLLLSACRPLQKSSTIVTAFSWRKANWEDTAALVLVTALSIAAALAFAALSKSPSWTGGRSDLDKQAPALQDSMNKLRATVASDEATLAGLKKAIAKDEARIASLEFQLLALESFLAISGAVYLISQITGGLFARPGSGMGSSNGAAKEASSSDNLDKPKR